MPLMREIQDQQTRNKSEYVAKGRDLWDRVAATQNFNNCALKVEEQYRQ